MKDEQARDLDITQLNQALEQRNAGRDYYEYFIPGSIKLVLATWPKEKLDRVAKDNERLFKYRFGFSTTKVVRGKAIDFQNKYDLSDDEIRWLRRAGHIRITRTEFHIDGSRLMPIYGWVQVAVLSMILCGGIFQVALSAEPEWKRMLGQITLGLIWLLAGGVLLKMFVLPWRTLKQSGAIEADDKLSA